MSKKDRYQRKLSGQSLAFRSRITNGTSILADVDGRSTWSRRFRDIVREHESDLGGTDTLSAGQKALIRRAALLQVELEFQEAKFATTRETGEEPKAYRLADYGTATNTLRRTLEALGLHSGRKMRNISPTVEEYAEIVRGRGTQ